MSGLFDFLVAPLAVRPVTLFLVVMAASTGAALLVRRFYRRTIDRLVTEAATDSVLEVMNYRECLHRLAEAIEESRRYEVPFSVCLIDVDGLKQMNDTYGYLAGDRLLQAFVRLARDSARATDLIFRYRQGDEFLILARHTSVLGAGVFAERLARAFEASRIEVEKDRVLSATLSVGVVGFDPVKDGAIDGSGLCARAERALSLAKKRINAVAIGEQGQGD